MLQFFPLQNWCNWRLVMAIGMFVFTLTNSVQAQTITEIPYPDGSNPNEPVPKTLAEAEAALQRSFKALHMRGYYQENTLFSSRNQLVNASTPQRVNQIINRYRNSIMDYYKDRARMMRRSVDLMQVEHDLYLQKQMRAYEERKAIRKGESPDTKWDTAVKNAEKKLKLAQNNWLQSLRNVNDYRSRNLPDNEQNREKLKELEQKLLTDRNLLLQAQIELGEAMRARAQAIRDSFVQPQLPKQPQPQPKENSGVS